MIKSIFRWMFVEWKFDVVGWPNIDIVNILTRRCATIHPFSFNRSVGRANSIVWINQKTLLMLVTMHPMRLARWRQKERKYRLPREMHTLCKMIDVFPYIYIYIYTILCKNNASMIASYFIFVSNQETLLNNPHCPSRFTITRFVASDWMILKF